MTIETRAFTNSFNEGIANVLKSEVFITHSFIPQKNEKFYPEKIRNKKCIAIWDTGATNTVISGRVVKECDLKPTGVVVVKHGGGKSTTNTYFVNVWLPNKVMMVNVRVSEGIIEEEDMFDVLIGMDIINGGDFAVTNKNGITVFTYRSPSVECIDFVKNPYKDMPITVEKKPERNDPCPCGSGKKYKKCCGK